MPRLNLAGAFPPVCTPFTPSGEVDWGKMERNVYKYAKMPIRGLVIGGSNGETVLQTDEERLQMVRMVSRIFKANAPDKIVIVGSGCQSTKATIQMTADVAAAGADAALVITPSFFKNAMKDKALTDYYTAVADASPIPVIIYNVAKFTNVDISPGCVAALCKHKNIVGIKDSGGNITAIALYVANSKGQDFQVLAGGASFLFPSLCVGAVGGVMALANFAAAHCDNVIQLYRKGDMLGAREANANLIPPNTAVTATFGVAGLKYCHDLVGLEGGCVRAPLMDISDEQRRALRGILTKAGILQHSKL